MLMPRTCSLSIGTAHESSLPRSLRFGAVPGSRMLGMMNIFGTMHSAWRTMRLPFGRSLIRLQRTPSGVFSQPIVGLRCISAPSNWSPLIHWCSIKRW